MALNIKQAQDSAEFYAIYRLQLEAEKLGVATTKNLSTALKKKFDEEYQKLKSRSE
jgi:hypothetical protein